MEIRRALAQDAPHINDIYTEAFIESERKEFSLLLSPRYETWVATEQNEICALAALIHKNNAVLLDYLAVKDCYRGKGVGDKLLNTLLDLYSYCDNFFLEIETPEKGASEKDNGIRLRRKQFYIRHGFREAGINVDINGNDMIVMCILPSDDDEQRYCSIYREGFKGLKNERYISKVISRYKTEN